MTVEIIGVRHFSPACARWVESRIAATRPRWVLIEGPSDFNSRIAELRLPHRLPIAIYSYFVDERGTHHCYSPFVEFAPEWSALCAATACRAEVRFIDLPYSDPVWHGKRLRYDVYGRHRRQRYAQAIAKLCSRFGMDGDDALWDHLFEATPSPDDFGTRLSTYFRELRGDEVGEHEDVERERFMARYVAWAIAQGGDVIVVCGGWHQAAIEMQLGIQVSEEPVAVLPEAIERHGSFVVPYSDRQLDALGGYGSGMQSPQYYRWMWEAGNSHAAEQATATIVRRLRQRRQQVSTASLVSARVKCEGLARLRGHSQPLRCDVLDGMLDAVLDGALDERLPWGNRDVLRPEVAPQIREMLLSLTGETRGALAPATPMPPLLADVSGLLEKHRLRPGIDDSDLRLDRRNRQDSERAQVLWRLRLLSIGAFVLESIQAAGAARSLAEDQRYVEHWRLRISDSTTAELIQAGAYGPDLESAALRCLSERLSACTEPKALADGVVEAIRAGFGTLAQDSLARLSAVLNASSNHGPLAAAGLRLHALSDQGFWGEELASTLRPLLDGILERLLWIVEGLSGPNAPASRADIDAIQFIDQRLGSATTSADPLVEATRSLLARHVKDGSAPPALRGACIGALWKYGGAIDATAVSATARSMASGSALGDFLCGLFALARHEVTNSAELIGALDEAITAYVDGEFLIALPALRQAFAWFPPRERGELAHEIARRHGRGLADASRLTHLPAPFQQLVDARELEARVLARAKQYGLYGEDKP